ncbi:TetR/AcrR family transcriptional regulator [Mycolicibacterium llatzerense]|uniref:TetR/AcrR family transcriptional regulator n=1 Tax=Mycolicibacterium llatzerense TaxID=280871 RepID=UPI0021B52B57|nr:TetR/AcrR family transcriptional regulator [Mycolicibacterium llatzerense]
MNRADPADAAGNGQGRRGAYRAASSVRRGDLQRDAILNATRELLSTNSFESISVSAITARAGITRSGFYFYFDSKHAVLATMLRAAVTELDELTDHFAPRTQQESPEMFVSRMVGTLATVTSRNDPVMAACQAARQTDAEIRAITDELSDAVIAVVQQNIAAEVAAGTAAPIVDDTAALVRILSATTRFAVSGDTAFVRSADDLPRALHAIEQLWLHAFWGCR